MSDNLMNEAGALVDALKVAAAAEATMGIHKAECSGKLDALKDMRAEVFEKLDRILAAQELIKQESLRLKDIVDWMVEKEEEKQ